MLSLHIATVSPKLSPPSHQLSSYSAVGKRTPFTTVLVGAGSSTTDDHLPPTAICYLKGVNPLTTDTQRLPFLTRPPSVRDINSDTWNDDITNPNPNPSPNFTISHSSFATDVYPRSIFPVYGPFGLLHCLQTGAFGSAWAAKDHSTGRLLCLKVFQSVQNPDVSRSVRTELTTFRRMVKSKRGDKGSQFIMELNKSMQHDTNVLFAMELMTTDLASYFSIEPERCKLHARRWMAQIALGIQSLHEMAIIHRDIKTENILIDSRENIRIIDFGLAYLGCTSRPIRAIEFLGTPPYMAPEVLQNKGLSIDQRMYYGIAIDWWALGCILHELESRDHQLLFDTEEDVHAYVAWIQRPGRLEQTYSRFDGFNPATVDLLEGLLRVQPSTRFSLNDMEKHAYFLRRDGTSEFDNAAARALERPVRADLVPQFTRDHQPIKVIEAGKAVTSNDWTNLKLALVDI